MRFSINLLVICLGVIISYISYMYIEQIFTNPGVCPMDPFACYFSDGYYQARALFREKANLLPNVSMHTKYIKNDQNIQDLTIDVAIINKPTKQEDQTQPALIHVSGTHGVEGYAGSAIQIAFLDKVNKKEIIIPDNVTIVLIHAINPFGFLFNRRWNENQVDLNRNFFCEDIFEGDLAELVKLETLGNYKEFEHRYNLDHAWITPLDDIIYTFNTIYDLITKGFLRIKSAAVSGQYYCSDCIWYGGKEIQPSVKFATDFLKEHIGMADRSIFIDVHTGLGREGRDVLLGSSKASEAITQIFGQKDQEDILGVDFEIDSNINDNDFGKLYNKDKNDGNLMKQAVNTPQSAQGAGYDQMRGGSIQMPYCAKQNRAVQLIQEFGTIQPLLVLKAIIEEHSYWNKGGSKDQLVLGGQIMKKSFHRETQFYKNNVVRRGLVLIEQSLKGLTDDSKSKYIPYLFKQQQ